VSDRWLAAVPVAVLAATLVYFQQSDPSLYRIQLVTLAGIWAIAAIGLGLLLGGAGQINLGQAGFVGAGAWAVGVLTREQDWPFLLAVLVAILVATLIGFLVGFATLRLEGHYLALATLAFGLLFFEVMDTFLPSGIYGVPAVRLFGWKIGTAESLMFFVWALVILVYAAARSMLSSRYGRALSAMRDDSLAAASCGIDLPRMRIQVFALCAGVGGLAGALFAPYQTSVTDSSFGFFLSVNLLLMVVIGGLRSPMGAILGALFLVIIPEFGRDWERYRLFGYGIVLIAVIIALPEGLTGIGRSIVRWVAIIFSRGRVLRPPRLDKVIEASPQPERLARSADGNVLSVSGVSRSFGGLAAVSDVSLDLSPGEVHALIGPNGAGKTTFFNCISGVDTPDSGSVIVNGEDLTGSPAHVMTDRGLSRTFQHARPFRGLSVRQNVMVGAHVRSSAGIVRGTVRTPGARKEHRRLVERADELLELVGLDHLRTRSAGLLTLAEERRLELARCLASDPAVLLLDEPAAGLGDEEADELASLIVSLGAEHGIGVILIEHHLEMALGAADQVTVLNFGKVIRQGSPAEVRQDQAVIEAYIGSAG